MQTPDHTKMSVPTDLTLTQRLRRIAPYFGNQRLAWGLAILATLVGAGTEPLMPALLKPLLDSGFTDGTLSLWTVPVASSACS
jgi:subfamily B ATP-binding cassette protein MsbA